MKDQAGESCSICAWVDHQSKQTTDAPLEQCLSTPSLRMQCAITSHGAGVHPLAGMAVSTGIPADPASRAYLVMMPSTLHDRASEAKVTCQPLRAALASPLSGRALHMNWSGSD